MKIISRKEAIEQGLKNYFTGKPCKYGHISERRTRNGSCAECEKAYKAAWRKANPEKVKASAATWQKANPEKVKATTTAWRKANPEKVKASGAAYQEANTEKVKVSKTAWQKANPEVIFIRSSLKRIFNNWKGGRAKCEDLLEYTHEDLRVHLERQFLKGMSWENRNEWHIDHITPISYYLKNGVTDPKIINCLSNLRPMWAKDNMSKGAATTLLC